MKRELEKFNVDVEFDEASGLYDVTGDHEDIVEVQSYLDKKGFINDNAKMGMFFGIKSDESKINRLLVFIDGDNKGYLPVAA